MTKVYLNEAEAPRVEVVRFSVDVDTELDGVGVGSYAITEDTTCGATSRIRLYDTANCSGAGNALCFWGAGQADLGMFALGMGTWAGATLAYETNLSTANLCRQQGCTCVEGVGGNDDVCLNPTAGCLANNINYVSLP